MRLLLKWLICFGALAVAALGFPRSFTLEGGIFTLAAAATVLWLANLLIRPVLQLISLPVTLVTFGIFALIVNTWMVCLADALIPPMHIGSFFLCLFTAILVSVGNSLFLVRRHGK